MDPIMTDRSYDLLVIFYGKGGRSTSRWGSPSESLPAWTMDRTRRSLASDKPDSGRASLLTLVNRRKTQWDASPSWVRGPSRVRVTGPE